MIDGNAKDISDKSARNSSSKAKTKQTNKLYIYIAGIKIIVHV